ncbi:MAG: hypothetical protein K6B75_01035 [Lachnospiraceae bacterium]|nr:hypothetical protein [Lachnospiraceae bacterium]
MSKFAVIDTETNWIDQVMSVGIVVADDREFEVVDKKYVIFEAEADIGGMYYDTLNIDGIESETTDRVSGVQILYEFLKRNNVEHIFAYNASFDYNHMPELRGFLWHDIMKIAAYKQYNHAIPCTADCFKTGRMKSGYGVESVLNMFGECGYCELHNALADAVDELRIMKYLDYSVKDYPDLKS